MATPTPEQYEETIRRVFGVEDGYNWHVIRWRKFKWWRTFSFAVNSVYGKFK